MCMSKSSKIAYLSTYSASDGNTINQDTNCLHFQIKASHLDTVLSFKSHTALLVTTLVHVPQTILIPLTFHLPVCPTYDESLPVYNMLAKLYYRWNNNVNFGIKSVSHLHINMPDVGWFVFHACFVTNRQISAPTMKRHDIFTLKR